MPREDAAGEVAQVMGTGHRGQRAGEPVESKSRHMPHAVQAPRPAGRES